MIALQQEGIDHLVGKFFPYDELETPPPPVEAVEPPQVGGQQGFQGSDDELIQAALRAKNGDKIRRLLDGDISDYGGDRSRADQALANALAFWVGPTGEDRLVRLMLSYGPKRVKWTERLGTKSDYLRDTARKAIRDCRCFYAPKPLPYAIHIPSAGEAGSAQTNGSGVSQKRFHFMSAAAFFDTRFEQDFLIDGVLVRGQPGVIAGGSKGMKTTLAIESSISLATGTDFLGKYAVPKPVRVALVSGESGGRTIQETAIRICKAKGVNPSDLQGWWAPCFDLPRFTDLAGMKEFAGELVALKADVVFIDPTYLCIGGDVNHGNLFEMGEAFRTVSEELLAVGCTPILVHHANRGLQHGHFMELRDLSHAGLEQFARQWLLINRQRAYQGDGIHDLLVSIGGSAGHSMRLAVRIDEGSLNNDFTGRTWNVTVETAEEAAAGRQAAKQDRRRQASQADEELVLQAIDAEISEGHAAATRSAIRACASKLSGTKLKAILDRLSNEGRIELVPLERLSGNGAKQAVDGFRRVAV